MNKAHDVYHKLSDKLIGFKWGDQPGGLVYDAADTNKVVGQIRSGVVRGQHILWAQESHHTGRRFDGDEVVWDNRPSKRFG
jgi:hypothetical protein